MEACHTPGRLSATLASQATRVKPHTIIGRMHISCPVCRGASVLDPFPCFWPSSELVMPAQISTQIAQASA